MDPMGIDTIYMQIFQQKENVYCKYNIAYTIPYMDPIRYWGGYSTSTSIHVWYISFWAKLRSPAKG